jgi:predicted transcriptional regulator
MTRKQWRYSEIQFLIDNYDTMTTEELCKNLSGRSKKSINRKLEKLRSEGKIGHRTDETVRRAYSQRKRGAGDSPSKKTKEIQQEEVENDYFF